MAKFSHIVAHDTHAVRFGPRAERWGADGGARRRECEEWDLFCDSLARPYEVLEWGSHPDAGNDDCHAGASYATLDEAIAVYEKDVASHCRFVEMKLSGVRIALHENPAVASEEDDDADWRREIAMEAGMLHGIDAYNEAMGY
jgi:hypothetical protein